MWMILLGLGCDEPWPAGETCVSPLEWYAPADTPDDARSSAEILAGELPPCPGGAYNPARHAINDCFPPSWCEPSLANCGAYECWYCVEESELRDWAEDSMYESSVTCAPDSALDGVNVCRVTCE